MNKLTDKEKLAVAVKTLKIYANIDLWNYQGFSNKLKKPVCGSKLDPKYTSLEVKGKDGMVKDGWEWAEIALKEMEM